MTEMYWRRMEFSWIDDAKSEELLHGLERKKHDVCS